jgi:hypothetical protein
MEPQGLSSTTQKPVLINLIFSKQNFLTFMLKRVVSFHPFLSLSHVSSFTVFQSEFCIGLLFYSLKDLHYYVGCYPLSEVHLIYMTGQYLTLLPSSCDWLLLFFSLFSYWSKKLQTRSPFCYLSVCVSLSTLRPVDWCSRS